MAEEILKSGIDIRQVTTPILRHLLKGQIRFPLFFLLKWRLTFYRLVKRIDPRFPKDLVELAGLPIWIYMGLKAQLGQKKAFEIMRVVTLSGGLAKWSETYRTAEKERTFENLCDTELKVNATGFTKWNALEVVERSSKRFEIKITRCLYHELTTSLGVPEPTPVICQIDNAAFNSYLPDKIIFNRGGPGNRIADGKKECNFIWELKS